MPCTSKKQCNLLIPLTFKFKQLPVTLTCMIAHGHGDEKYVQYLNELWPNDPNFTIGSFLWFFCILEIALITKSKLLLEEPTQNSFFVHLLQGKSCCIHELCTLEKIVNAKHVPRNLLLQVNNCMKDNKNQRLLTFLSLLIVRDVFEEMKLGFLFVGHTHENIYGCFDYL